MTQKLIEGLHRFRKDSLGKYQELFHRLSHEGQHPHTLFITCSDSRILAEMLTHSKPGDLFVVKNVGNIIPPVESEVPANSTAAAIEFAVVTLQVRDIVICGHSLCGAMSGLLDGVPDPARCPHLVQWLKVAEPVHQLIKEKYKNLTCSEKRATAAAQENVLFGLENLQSYPAVRERIEAGALRLHGWFFKIATAEMFAYNLSSEQFEPILDSALPHS